MNVFLLFYSGHPNGAYLWVPIILDLFACIVLTVGNTSCEVGTIQKEETAQVFGICPYTDEDLDSAYYIFTERSYEATAVGFSYFKRAGSGVCCPLTRYPEGFVVAIAMRGIAQVFGYISLIWLVSSFTVSLTLTTRFYIYQQVILCYLLPYHQHSQDYSDWINNTSYNIFGFRFSIL